MFFTVDKRREFLWKDSGPVNFDPHNVPNSNKLESVFSETQGLYGIKSSVLLKKQTRVGFSPMKIQIPRIESFFVNDAEDLEIVRRLSKDKG